MKAFMYKIEGASKNFNKPVEVRFYSRIHAGRKRPPKSHVTVPLTTDYVAPSVTPKTQHLFFDQLASWASKISWARWTLARRRMTCPLSTRRARWTRSGSHLERSPRLPRYLLVQLGKICRCISGPFCHESGSGFWLIGSFLVHGKIKFDILSTEGQISVENYPYIAKAYCQNR